VLFGEQQQQSVEQQLGGEQQHHHDGQPDQLQAAHQWQSKCQELAEKVKEALKATPAPNGAYKIASLLKCGALTGTQCLVNKV
jgi:hypothetical protein